MPPVLAYARGPEVDLLAAYDEHCGRLGLISVNLGSAARTFRAIVNTYLLVNGAPAARTPGQNRTAGRSIHRLGAECRWWTVHPLW
jgi:hypothetical protein